MSDSFNLEHLRKEAKSLLKLCRTGDPSAIERVQAQIPRVDCAQIKLADVHHALAREHGYRNWAELKQQDAPLARFLSAVRNGSLQKAQAELENFPELPVESIHAACAVGDVDAVAYHLDLDPESIRVEENGWTPLLYACASRFHKLSERHAAGIIACVKLLLDRGASPNSYSLIDPTDAESKLDAVMRANLTGRNGAVSRLLLERGAAPVDPRNIPKAVREESRRLFPRAQLDAVVMQLSEKDSAFKDELQRRLRPFFHFHRAPGVAPPTEPKGGWLFDPELRKAAMAIGEWLLEKGFSPNVTTASGGNTMLHELVSLGDNTVVAESAEWLIAHGADPNIPRDDGRTPYVLAVRMGNRAVADAMRRNAKVVPPQPIDEFIGACALRDEQAALQIARDHPDVRTTMKTAEHQMLVDAASQNRLDDVRFMARVGFDLAASGESGATALHAAAWNGHAEMVRLLLEYHSPVNIRDSIYGTSPMAWAAHGSRHSHKADEDYCAILQLLLDAGANRADSINAWGIKPEETASEKVAAFLESQ